MALDRDPRPYAAQGRAGIWLDAERWRAVASKRTACNKHTQGEGRLDMRMIKPEGSTDSGRTVLIVCIAHFMSHCYLMLLPPVFLLMAPHYGVGFTQLGLALTIFSLTTTLSQPPVGRMVDRIGAREILAGGLILGGLSFVMIGLAKSYVALLALMALAGLANSAYHPADYAILGRCVSPGNMGKAFSVHTFAGFLGGAVTPIVMTMAATLWSWQAGVVAAGIVGVLIGAFIPLIPRMPVMAGAEEKGEAPVKVRVNATIVSLTIFFFLVSLSTSGIQSFSVAALTTGWGISLADANTKLTIFLVAMSAGVLAGGMLADRSAHHETIAAICFGFAGIATLLMVVPFVNSHALSIVFGMAGFLVGVVMPSRDMMVHRAATPATTGSVFGIVMTGLNAGGIVAPPMFGLLVDHNVHAGIFVLSAGAMMLTALLALSQTSGSRPQRK